ncbi:MAG: hypothetical protein ACXWEI_22205 [Mycobacterium sp.]
MANLERLGAVFVLTLGENENRFHPDNLAAINAALDEVEAADGASAVVTTGGGKFYSNGLDLDFMPPTPTPPRRTCWTSTRCSPHAVPHPRGRTARSGWAGPADRVGTAAGIV